MSDTNENKRIGSGHETQRIGAHTEPERIAEHSQSSPIPEVEAADPIIEASQRGTVRPAVPIIILLAALIVAGLLFFATRRGTEFERSRDTQAFYMGPTKIQSPGATAVDASRVTEIYASSPRAAAKAIKTAVNDSPSSSAAGETPTVVVYLFNYDSNNVPENATLTNLASELTASGRDVAIVAYTDPRGSRDYNMRLSQRRADAIGDYLVAHGVDRSHVKCKGAGPTNAFASEQQDRRAEITPL